MTKEELEKEAEELIQRFEMANSMNCYMLLTPDRKQIGEMLVMIAEPREKRIAELEKENEELKAQIEEMKCWYKMDYNDKESCKKIPQGIQLLTEYDCGLFVAYCVNRWTGDHWEEHSYGITRWKEIKEK